MKRDLPGSSGDADVMADWSAASVFSSLLFLSLFYDLPLCVCLVVHLFLFLSFSVPSLSSVSGAGDGEDNGHSFLLFLFSLFVLFICSLCVVPQYYLRSSPAFLVRSLSPPVSPQFVLPFPSFFLFPSPCVVSSLRLLVFYPLVFRSVFSDCFSSPPPLSWPFSGFYSQRMPCGPLQIIRRPCMDFNAGVTVGDSSWTFSRRGAAFLSPGLAR